MVVLVGILSTTFTGGSGSLSESSSWVLPVCKILSVACSTLLEGRRFRHTEKLVQVLLTRLVSCDDLDRSWGNANGICEVCLDGRLQGAKGCNLPWKQHCLPFCPPTQSPPKKALLPREQFVRRSCMNEKDRFRFCGKLSLEMMDGCWEILVGGRQLHLRLQTNRRLA